MELPKNTKSNRTGRKGLNIIQKIVETQLNWTLRVNHQEDDFGIDAYIDLIEDGCVTGKSIAIQVKTGQSYLKELDETNWDFKGKLRHLNYYLNHDIPVLIVLVDDEKETAYWEICKPEFTSRVGNSWSLPIPKTQQLDSNHKDNIRKYVSPEVDYVSQLEGYWNFNGLLAESGHIMLVAGKDDVSKLNYKPLIAFMCRVCGNKSLIHRLREKIEIGVHGYDMDNRELYEIEEVKKWTREIFTNVPGLSYFLFNKENAQFLKLFMFSLIDMEYVSGNFVKLGKQNRRKVEYDSKELGKVFPKVFSDLNDFTKSFKIDKRINEKISSNIASCLTGEDIPITENNFYRE